MKRFDAPFGARRSELAPELQVPAHLHPENGLMDHTECEIKTPSELPR
jgi:hypothetical protein